MYCTRNANVICPKSGTRTFRDTRLAVGLLVQRVECGPDHPTGNLLAENTERHEERIFLTENGNWQYEEQVNKEELWECKSGIENNSLSEPYLDVAEVRARPIEYAHGCELDGRV